MAERSMFGRGGSGMTRGGLDRYLGPTAIDDSNLPLAIEDPEHVAEPEVPVDCAGADKGQAVCEIAKAEQAVDKAG